MIDGVTENFFKDIKKKISIKDESSYVFWFEIIINGSRSLGYVILIIVLKFAFNLNVIAILIALFTLVYISFAFVLSKIGNKYLVGFIKFIKKIIS